MCRNSRTGIPSTFRWQVRFNPEYGIRFINKGKFPPGRPPLPHAGPVDPETREGHNVESSQPADRKNPPSPDPF